MLSPHLTAALSSPLLLFLAPRDRSLLLRSLVARRRISNWSRLARLPPLAAAVLTPANNARRIAPFRLKVFRRDPVSMPADKI